MTNCVQKITVTQKFKTQPIYVNPEPDGGVTILDNSEVIEARESYFGGTESTLQARLTKDFKNLNDKFLPVEEKVNSIETEIKDARTGYNGEKYDNLNDRINGDINGVLDKVGTVNYKDTTIHANNTIKRNLVANRNKVEVLGQTIQNCLDHSTADKFSYINGTVEDGYIKVNTTNSPSRIKKENGILKPSTKYTFIIEVLNNDWINDDTARLYFGQYVDSTSVFTSYFSIPLKNYLGIYKTIQTTKEQTTFDTMKDAVVFGVYNNTVSGTLKFRIAIVEGDWTNKEISFVPFGLNYPETTEVVEYGQNIFNKDDLTVGGYDEKGLLDKSIDYRLSTETKLPVFGQSNIVIDGLPSEIYAIVVTWDISGKLLDRIANISNNSPTKINSNSSKIAFTFYKGSSVIVNKDELEKVNINYGSSVSTYQEYTERKVNINYPLASVSDTIRDKYYVKDGNKYHEQVTEEAIINGENAMFTAVEPNIPAGYTRFRLSNIKNKVNSNLYNLKCNKLPLVYVWDEFDENIGICLTPSSASELSRGLLFLRLKNEMLTSLDEAGVRKWLNENPLTIRYELAIPITTEIETDDMQSFDGQTNITTTNTVKPTLDIDIPSDLNAVVSNLMVENASLQAENQALNSELENQASSIESQKANMDYISMMTGVEL